jgi:hypothetical protein
MWRIYSKPDPDGDVKMLNFQSLFKLKKCLPKKILIIFSILKKCITGKVVYEVEINLQQMSKPLLVDCKSLRVSTAW